MGFSCHGAEKNDDITVSDGAEGAVAVHDLGLAVDEAADFRRNQPAFEAYVFHILDLGIIILRLFDILVDEADGDRAAAVIGRPLFLVASRVERFRRPVVQLQISFRHDLAEDEIDGRKDGRIASEILIEVDPVVCSSLIRAEVIVLSEEYRRVRLTEAVNALLDVADHEAVVSAGEKGGDEFLHAVRVLVLIDHDFLVT